MERTSTDMISCALCCWFYCLLTTFCICLALPLTLAVADWSVAIEGVYGQSIDFSTGNSVGASMKVELFDVCRVDSATRTALGTIFPHASTVTGIDEDHSAIVNDPGAGNKIIFSFNSAINTTSIYTNNGDDTATVAFCAQVALYDGSTLVNLAEVKVEYTIDLLTDQATLAFNSITSAAGYTDAADSVVTFDGTLQAFFCNPSTYGILPYNELKTTQGSSISVCFQVPDGQFEVKDVVALTVKNANDI